MNYKKGQQLVKVVGGGTDGWCKKKMTNGKKRYILEERSPKGEKVENMKKRRLVVCFCLVG